MTTIIEKGLFTTVGAFIYFQEKAGKAVREMMERGRLAPEEGRRLIEDMAEKFEREAGKIRINIENETEEKTPPGAVEKDLKALKGRLSKIENRLDEIAAKLSK